MDRCHSKSNVNFRLRVLSSIIVLILSIVAVILFLSSSSFLESRFDSLVSSLNEKAGLNLSFEQRKIDLWGDIYLSRGNIFRNKRFRVKSQVSISKNFLFSNKASI